MWSEEDWEFCRDKDEDGPVMWMDTLHVKTVYALAMSCGFRSMLEIGCWDGYSTSALVQAKIDAACGLLTCCDVDIKPTLLRVLKKSRDGWRAWQGQSTDVLRLIEDQDLVVLDGDHSLPQVKAELDIIMWRKWPTIIAHDVGPGSGEPGPVWMLNLLRNDPSWFVLWDQKSREGMRTDRGLMLASRNGFVFRRAKGIFEALEVVP